MAQKFELLRNTADIKIRAYGATKEELFRNALKGMFASIQPQGPQIIYKNNELFSRQYTVEHFITIHSQDISTLLVDFLVDCLYLSDTHNQAYFDARFTLLLDTELQAYVYGVAVTDFKQTKIKTITYNNLILIQDQDGLWQATIVFDL